MIRWNSTRAAGIAVGLVPGKGGGFTSLDGTNPSGQTARQIIDKHVGEVRNLLRTGRYHCFLECVFPNSRI